MNSIHVKHLDVNYCISGINLSVHDKLLSLSALPSFGKAVSQIYPFLPDEDFDEDLDLKVVYLDLNQTQLEELELLVYC